MSAIPLSICISKGLNEQISFFLSNSIYTLSPLVSVTINYLTLFFLLFESPRCIQYIQYSQPTIHHKAYDLIFTNFIPSSRLDFSRRITPFPIVPPDRKHPVYLTLSLSLSFTCSLAFSYALDVM